MRYFAQEDAVFIRCMGIDTALSTDVGFHVFNLVVVICLVRRNASVCWQFGQQVRFFGNKGIIGCSLMICCRLSSLLLKLRILFGGD
jgi:hypothetical protein